MSKLTLTWCGNTLVDTCPRPVEHFDPDALRQISLYGSPEYFHPPVPPKSPPPMPLWTAPDSIRDSIVERAVRAAPATFNHEAHSPPVYYAIAGAWYNLGSLLGIRGGYLLYWIRFLNVPVYALVIFGSYRLIDRFYPDDRLLALGVPTLLTLFPQDVFYSINSDGLSPLFSLVALHLLLEWKDREGESMTYAVAGGTMVSLTILIKLSNVGIFVVSAWIFVEKGVRLWRAGVIRTRWREAVLFFVAIAVPISAWMVRNVVLFGDATGTAGKVSALGWTRKPVGEWLHHPVFTPQGFAYFWTTLFKTYWRGEIVWHLEILSPSSTETVLVGGTTLLILAFFIQFLIRRRNSPNEFRPDGYHLMAFGASVLFLIYLSIIFDFGKCWYPSRDKPFFVSGRLIIGTLVPFLILLVRGIQILVSLGLRGRTGPLFVGFAIGFIGVVCVISGYPLLEAASSSSFNWFHLK